MPVTDNDHPLFEDGTLETMVRNIKETYRVDSDPLAFQTLLNTQNRVLRLTLSKSLLDILLFEEVAQRVNEYDHHEIESYGSDVFWWHLDDAINKKIDLEDLKDAVSGKKRIHYVTTMHLNRIVEDVVNLVFDDILHCPKECITNIMVAQDKELMQQWNNKETNVLEFYVSMNIDGWSSLGLARCGDSQRRFDIILKGELEACGRDNDCEDSYIDVRDMLTETYINQLSTYYPNDMDICDIETTFDPIKEDD